MKQKASIDDWRIEERYDRKVLTGHIKGHPNQDQFRIERQRTSVLVSIDEALGTAETLKPGAALICKLGSIVVHMEELHSADGHEFDKAALDQLLIDPEVQEWIEGLRKMAMVPVKRKK
jgi:hypothetical protein